MLTTIISTVLAAAVAQAPAGYAGSQECRRCHAVFFERWSTSRHGRALEAFTPDFARRNLTWPSTPIRAAGASYSVVVSDKGGWMVEESDRTKRQYSIQYALGGKNIYYFLTPLERGHLQVMPLAFDVRARVWLDATVSMTMHQDGAADVPVDWRDRLLTFNTSCYGCHVSQLATNYEPASDSYRTTWAEPGINCETCHGPLAEHARGTRPGARAMTVAQRNDTCASCHAKLVPVAAGFEPGARFFDHYGLVTLESDDYYADGRDRRENYTLTSWLMSPCAKSGKLGCLHCHTSSGRYKFADDKDANNACLPCHQERVSNAAAHSRHAAGTAGSRCVSCHMPMTEYARMRRSDHSMRPPAPAATLAYGSPNACNGCHSDKDAAWADRQVRQWFHEDYQSPVLARAALIDAARKRDWSKLPEMLAFLDGPDRDPVFRASLIRLLEACQDERTTPALVRAFADPSPLVRASVVDAVADRPGPEAAGLLLAAARDPLRTVRIRAGAALAAVDSAVADRAAVDRAVAEYAESLRSRPDDWAQRMNLGVFHADRGQWDQALAEYDFAVRLRPGFAPPFVNAALVYNQLGRNREAEEALRKAVAIDPGNAAAHLNLGLLLAETERVPEAEAELRRSLALDARNATAAYNLAVLISTDRLAEAIELCRRAVDAAPREPRYSETLAYYLAQLDHQTKTKSKRNAIK